MNNARRMIATTAEACNRLIQREDTTNCLLPEALQPKHLQWMCAQIESQAATWPLSRLHRWMGFVQCALLANRMLDLEGAKRTFSQSKFPLEAHGDDQNLLDHLDLANSLDLGGRG